MNPAKIKNWCRINNLHYCNRDEFKDIVEGRIDKSECYYDGRTCDSYDLTIFLKGKDPEKFYKVGFHSICNGLDKMIFVHECIDNKYTPIYEKHHVEYEDYLEVEKILNDNTLYTFVHYSEEYFKECFTDLFNMDYFEYPAEDDFDYMGFNVKYDYEEKKYVSTIDNFVHKSKDKETMTDFIEFYHMYIRSKEV